MGILGETLTPEMAAQMNLDENQQGVLVQQVVEDSPASKAKLQNGDDGITAINGETLTTIEELKGYLSNTRPGQEVAFTLLRDGNELSILVTLEARPIENP